MFRARIHQLGAGLELDPASRAEIEASKLSLLEHTSLVELGSL